MNSITDPDTTAPDDDSAPRPPRTWWKRRSVLVSAGVVIVAAITVVLDLPLSSSRSSNVASVRSVIAEVASDVAPCSYSVNESLRLYADIKSPTLSSADRSEVPSLVRQDYEACSLVDANIEDLAGMDEPNSTLGRDLNQLVTQSLSWCETDAMRMIGDVSLLIQHPRNVAEIAELAKSEHELVSEGTVVEKSITALDKLLGMRSLPHLDLARP